jgi:Lipase (class 3)
MPFTPGFDRTEALDLLHFCAIIENGVAPPIPNEPPKGWTSVFVSPVIGPFDNLWQLWRRTADGVLAVAVRGTTMNAGSILEDLIALMIRSKGTLQLGPTHYDYQFAADPQADVHLGFSLGALLLLKDPVNGILSQLASNGVGAGSKVYVTGHSQGAAIATLIRSYLEYAPEAPKQVDYKTYVYAQPKPGNDHYAEDFESRFSDQDFAFRVTNSLDWVPQVPFTIEFVTDINRPNPLSVLAAMPLTLAILQKAVDQVMVVAHMHAQMRLQEAAASLARLGPLTPVTAPLAAATAAAPFALTLNYVNAGTEVALIGVPCVGDQCKDAFFEHHAATYYGLLQTQIPDV